MKLLIVSWYFPPANTIAAVRIEKLAHHLHRRGHEVRVLSARDLPVSQGLASELPPGTAIHSRWWDLAAVSARLLRAVKRWRPGSTAGRAAPAPTPAQAPEAGPATPTPRKPLRHHLRELLFFPDYQIGWIPFALRAGRRLLRGWRPDVVYASGPPFSTLVIGWRLARAFRLPLVVEFRDRWSDDPYDPPGAWRQHLDRWLERRIVADATALVTVSEPWAETYRTRFGKPTLVLANGYDPALVDPARASRPASAEGPLRIVYTGGIYPGRRDPALLFAAIARLGADPAAIQVDFYGTRPGHVWPLAERHGVTACVAVHPPLTQPEAVRRQLDADVLLLMQWQDPREQGNVPGKLFEYLGARRPILLIGLEGGVPHGFLTDRGAGHLARDPDQVAELLRDWLAQKRAGGIPWLPERVSRGLSHDAQFARLPGFLETVLAPGARTAAAPSGAPAQEERA